MKTDKKNMLSLGQRLKEARQSAGYTQEEMGELIGVSRSAIARWETGEIEPRLSHLVDAARLLKVSTDDLLGVEEKEDDISRTLSAGARKALKELIKELSKTK